MRLTDKAVSACVYALFVLADAGVGLTGPKTNLEELILNELEGLLELIPSAAPRELKTFKKEALHELKNGAYLTDKQNRKLFVYKLNKLLEYLNAPEEVYEIFDELLKKTKNTILLSNIRVAHG